MIGTIAGDIIGSPYVNNPVEDVTKRYFELFSSSQNVKIDGRRARTRTFEARPGVLSDLAKAAADWMLSGDRTAAGWAVQMERHLGERHPSGTEVLAVCGPIAQLASGTDDAVRLSSVAVGGMKPRGELVSAAADFTLMLRACMDGGKETLAKAKERLLAEGYDVNRNLSEIRPFLEGNVVKGEQGKLTFGDGETVRDASEVIPAVWASLNEGDSYEDAVRRSVAAGGDSSLTAALTGAAAELRWGVPEDIRSRAVDYLDAEDRALVNRYDRALKAMSEGESLDGVKPDLNGTRFEVVRLQGLGSIYVIPEDRKDIESAVKKLNAKAGRSEKKGDYAVIRPDALESTLVRLSRQADARGNDLDGTYVEHPRPEVKSLWFQDGDIRTAFTRRGEGVNGRKLPAESTRRDTLNDFNALKAYAEGVRTRLEAKVGFGPATVFAEKMLDRIDRYASWLSDGEGFNEDTSVILSKAQDYLEKVGAESSVGEAKANLAAILGDNPWMDGLHKELDEVEKEVEAMKGAHLHFASAFYPVVYDHSIELMQGDILRARVGIDDDGRFRVDTNAMTGGVHTEGIDGVLATMNLVPKNADMKDVMGVLDAYCLDYGRIEEEQEREALGVDDTEADAVKKKYMSNVDRALEDMKQSFDIAVMPAGPVLTGKAEAAREERRAESEERYAGMSRSDAMDSQAHKGSVFTIGHSNMSQDEFDALMKRHGIHVLVDIRSYPSSKFCPHFNQSNLERHEAEKDVEYHHFPEFGGHQYRLVKGEDGKDEKVRLSYEESMKTPEFKEGMKALRDCVKDGYRVALMCSENDPMDCHRMVMMGRALAHPEVYGSKAKPVDVQHITRQGYCLSQQHFERKLMETYGLLENPDEARQRQASVLDPQGANAKASVNPGKAEDPTFGKRLAEAYRQRGESLVNKTGKSQRVSLRRKVSTAPAPKRGRHR